MLRQRLGRRGFVPATVLSAALVSEGAARAAVTPKLANAVLQAALQTVTGQPFSGLLIATRFKALMALVLLAGMVWASALVGSRPKEDKAPLPLPPRTQARKPVDEPLPSGALARLGTTRFRHEAWVEAAAFSPNGRTLASAGGSDIILWDAATGRERGRLAGKARGVLSLAYSRDGRFLASGGTDNAISIWDVATRKELRTFKGNDRVLASASNGSYVNADNKDRCTIRLWDVVVDKELRRLEGHRGGIYGLSFSSDGGYLVSSSTDTTLSASGCTSSTNQRTTSAKSFAVRRSVSWTARQPNSGSAV